MSLIIKRDGTLVSYNPEKIRIALEKANSKVIEKEKITKKEIDKIIDEINYRVESEKKLNKSLTVETIQDIIESLLFHLRKEALFKEYSTYRYSRELVRKANTTDESILTLVRNKNEELLKENSNKNPKQASTQRDYIAGIVSNDLSMRILLDKKIADAHEKGILHFHDKDYFIQNIHNCCLVNVSDMLDNGTVMNGKMIESPKSFQVACTVLTQIIAAVASNQYGGQSVDIKHLGKYLRKTYDKAYKKWEEKGYDHELCVEYALDKRTEELKSGIQTMQYQINTLMTTNGLVKLAV